MPPLGTTHVGTYQITCCGEQQSQRLAANGWGAKLTCRHCDKSQPARRID